MDDPKTITELIEHAKASAADDLEVRAAYGLIPMAILYIKPDKNLKGAQFASTKNECQVTWLIAPGPDDDEDAFYASILEGLKPGRKTKTAIERQM